MVTVIQNQRGPNQPAKCEEELEEIAKVAAQIRDESTKNVSQLIPSTSTNNATQSLDVHQTSTPESSSKDRASIEGKFGWTQFGDNFIPYIMRSQEKYVAVEMMNCNVICNYVQYFKEELYNCLGPVVLQMTKVEAKLLNEINFTHCDNSLGSFVYPDTSGLISLNDANGIYEFLNFCLEKLIQKSVNTSKGGFMKPTRQGCIPYVWIDGKQYVPFFYLDGKRVHLLEERSIELKGWKLAYMKLFCKIQGIGKHLFDHSSIRVIDLEVVKKFFLPGTTLEESWPTEHRIESLIVNQTQPTIPQANNRENVPQIVSLNAQTEGTQGMNMTPASEKASSTKNAPAQKTAKPNAASEKASSRKNTVEKIAMPIAASAKAISSRNALAKKIAMSISASDRAISKKNAPAEKTAKLNAASETDGSRKNTVEKIAVAIAASEKTISNKNTSAEKTAEPNTVSEKASSRTNTAEKTAMPNSASEKAIFKKNSPFKQAARLKPLPYNLANKPDRCTKVGSTKNITVTSPSARPAVANSVHSADNLTAQRSPIEFLDKSGRCKLYQIPDFPFHNREPPYFLLRSQVENRVLNFCINLYPYNSSVLLISAEEIATNFFKLPLTSFVKAVNCLRLDIYLPNTEQIKLFDANNVYPIMGLIKLSDLMDNISNIKTMMWCYTYN